MTRMTLRRPTHVSQHAGRIAGAALVAAGLMFGMGAQRAAAGLGPGQGPLPLAPELVSVESVSPTAIRLTYRDRAGSEEHFNIIYGRDMTMNQRHDDLPALPDVGRTATFTVTGLQPQTMYCFKMESWDWDEGLLGKTKVWSLIPSVTKCATTPATPATSGTNRLPDKPIGKSGGTNRLPDEPLQYTPDLAAWPTIREGAQGEPAKTVQYLLRYHGATLVVDGDYGPVTAAAVRTFQRQKGLDADGVVGPQTWEALMISPVGPSSQGEPVRAVQSQLASRGVAIAVTGTYGPETVAAVKAYQQPRALASHGMVARNTWQALVTGR